MTASRPTVALAVSGHGFGHAVRCAEVARSLLARGARVLVRSEAPRWLFPEEAEQLPRTTECSLDVGVVQHDGLDVDIDATRERWRTFAHDFERHADAEAELLRRAGANLLLGDVPPLAFVAARRAGIPALALANFGWDWIYAAWRDFEEAVACVQRGYAQADVLVRLPLHSSDVDAFPAFRRIEDVPLIGRTAQRPRCDVRKELGLAIGKTVVLLSFGGFGANGLDIAALGQWTEYAFVLTPPLALADNDVPPNVVRLTLTPGDYVSLLAACDVVVTKPGYGIVADCLANRVSVLFTDRGPFREYDVLAAALPSLGRARYVPRADLLAGALGPHLDALLASHAEWTNQPMNGADVVADRVLAHIQQGREMAHFLSS